jgi:hypothetical protein
MQSTAKHNIIRFKRSYDEFLIEDRRISSPVNKYSSLTNPNSKK